MLLLRYHATANPFLPCFVVYDTWLLLCCCRCSSTAAEQHSDLCQCMLQKAECKAGQVAMLVC